MIRRAMAQVDLLNLFDLSVGFIAVAAPMPWSERGAETSVTNPWFVHPVSFSGWAFEATPRQARFDAGIILADIGVVEERRVSAASRKRKRIEKAGETHRRVRSSGAFAHERGFRNMRYRRRAEQLFSEGRNSDQEIAQYYSLGVSPQADLGSR